MRYLVTGAAGFLGTNLCLRLLSEGQEVVGLDNLSTGSSRNLAALKKKKGFVFVKHDLVKPLPEGWKVDFVYNLACPASPPRYQKDPVQTFRTSVWGVWNLIEFARAQGTPIFHASTSEVYGDPLVQPQSEGYMGNVNPVGVRACYDEGKRGAEALLMDYWRTTKNPIKIARIFNTYGPYMDPDDGRVVSNFIVQASRGESLTVYGDGDQTRSFCFVDDMVGAFLKFEKSPASFCGPVNLGNDAEFSILGLASELGAVLGKKLGLRYLPLPADDPVQRKPDLSLARKALRWEPSTSLRQGLKKTVDYFMGLGKGDG